MRPKRYPYRQKEPTKLMVDPKDIITKRMDADDITTRPLKDRIQSEVAEVGDIEIDLEKHDVLLTARFQRPLLMIDGNIIGGLSTFNIHHTLEKTTAVVRLNEWLCESPYPFNDFTTLQKLYGVGHPKLTVREAIAQRVLGVHSD